MTALDLHRLVTRIAARAPGLPAVEEAGTVTTYGALEARAVAYAGALRRAGARPGDLVAIVLPRSAELVAAVLGTLQAGCVFLPLEPSQPTARLSAILADATPAACVHEAGFTADVPSGTCPVPAAAVTADAVVSADERPDEASALAYCIFTSGSTGGPKGALLTHAGLRTVIDAQREIIGPTEGDRVAQFASPGFDAFVFETVLALANGATLVVVPDAAREDPAELLAFLERARVTVAVLPSILTGALSRLPAGAPALRTVVSAGDVLPPAAVRDWPHAAQLFNAYGPTEATIWSTVHRCSPGDAGDAVPIGVPIPGVTVRVCDEAGADVPHGAVGEIRIGGPVVAAGYLNRPELTAERFPADPHGACGERVYRTGDLARVREDGALEFLGRGDHQVKVRGFRIELGEIEAALRADARVTDAVVLALGEGDERALVGFATARGPVDEGDLHDMLAARLPGHMLPARLHILDALPVTPSGKPDRAALAAHDAAQADAGEAPANPAQAAVARIWCEILKVSFCPVDAAFLACGGHSLAAVQVANRLTEDLLLAVTPVDLLQGMTIAALAERLQWSPGTEGPHPAEADDGRPADAPQTAEVAEPAALGQVQVAFANAVAGTTAAYVSRARVELLGALDVEALRAALEETVRRHEALRTRFELRDGELWQVVAPRADTAFQVVDARPGTGQQEELLAAMAAEVLDPSRLPLVAWALLRFAPDRHVLLHVEHHYIHDGWSFRLFLGELAELYSASVRGRPADLPEPVQFRTFARHQHDWLRGPEAAELAAYWRKVLHEAPTTLRLPALEPGHPGGPRCAVRRHHLDPRLVDAVETAAARLGLTSFQVMFGTFALLMTRHTGSHDFVLGTTVANRTRSEWEGVLGMVVNLVPVRVTVPSQATAGTVLTAVRDSLLAALRGSELPFARVAAVAPPSPPDEPHPLVQVVFSIHSALSADVDFFGLRAEIEESLPNEAAKFPLNVTVIQAGGTDLLVEHDTARFAADGVERLVGEYLDLLAAVAAGPPDGPAEALGRRAPAEHPALRQPTEREPRPLIPPAPPNPPSPSPLLPPPGYETATWRGGVAARFARLAAEQPGRIAVVAGPHRWTYGDLDRRRVTLARHLARLGVAPGDRVALLLQRGPDALAAMLATMSAGAVYVPLDPAQPAARIALLVALADPRAVLVDPGSADGWRAHGLAVTELTHGFAEPADAADPADPADPAETRPAALTPASPAYCCFTSGSTGEPKGVLVPHGALENVLDFFQAQAPDRFERFLAVTTTTFDIANLELLLPLCHGGRVVLADDDARRDGVALLDVARREAVTVIQATPSTWRLITAAESWPAWSDRSLLAISGGEALPVELSAELRTRLDVVWNVYGPTETTIWSTWHRCDGDRAEGPYGPYGPYEPIGRPIGATTGYVLDERGDPVVPGQAGELFIGGAGVALGYLGRPDLTAERFVTDVPGGEGRPVYRTGDLVRRLPGGALEFLGRLDDQTKVNGFRVEPGEIEAALRKAGARDAVVLARTSPSGQVRLIAFVLDAGEGGAAHESELRGHLAALLPAYLMPAALRFVPAFPLTPNGKVDRRALLSAESAVTADDRAAELWWPGDARLRDRLIAIVRRIEPECACLPYATYAETGLHSLALMRLTALAGREFGVSLTLLEVRDARTLAALCSLIAARTGGTPEPEEPAAPPALDSAPLSPAQRRMWALAQMPGMSAAYHLPLGFRLTGALDRAALRAALDRLADRHDVLRARIADHGDGPALRIEGGGSGFPLAEYDLRGREGAPAERDRLLEEAASQPFDLAGGPLVRGCLIMAEDEEEAGGRPTYDLLLVLHHIIADGWSLDVLCRDLGRLYAAFRDGAPDPLEPLPIRYADYAAQESRATPGLTRATDYWRTELAGAPAVCDLPADRPRPAVPDGEGGLVHRALDAETSAAIRELAGRYGATVFETLLASWAAVVGRLSGQDDVVIGIPAAGRDREELADLVGLFVNTLPIRLDSSGAPTVAQWLHRVATRARHAQDHAELPFEQIVEAAGVRRSPARLPLCQVFFAWQESGTARLGLPGVAVGPLPRPEHRTAKFDLALMVADVGGRIEADLEYASALFERETAERYLDHWRTLVAAMAADPDRPLERLPLLGPEERAEVLRAGGGTVVVYPDDRGVHELFRDRVATAPHALAVVHGDRGVTYAELDALAGGLAVRLRDAGVRPGDRVAVVLERSAELVAAELAALYCGASYVPLDPDFPPARQEMLLRDSQARAVVVTAGTDVPTPAGVPRVEPGTPAEVVAADVAGTVPGSAAYVMYTSGSTGEPKGVVVGHRGIRRLVERNGYADFRPGDRTACIANPAFDASTMEVWGPLVTGGTIVVVDREDLLDPVRFARVLRDRRIATMFLTAGLFHRYAEPVGEALAGLRHLLIGGDVVDPHVLRRFLAAGHRPGHVLNAYGPTETTTFALTHEVTDLPADAVRVPIGRPIANTRAYVLDRHRQPQPIGVVGELYIGGDGVALGYLGRPDLTEERFPPDPFAPGDATSPGGSGPGGGARMYQTGDLARRLPDGTVEFVGRVDTQVKIRGFRVEPGEVETWLARHPAVREAAVVARRDEAGEARLAAYYTVAGEEPAVAGLRSWLAARVPAPMVPDAWIRLAALPMTPTGKLDRRALPDPSTAVAAGAVHEPPAGPTEEALAAIWAEVLGRPRIGRTDHFFDLGGHSLTGIQLISRVRGTFDVEISILDVFQHPVLADLAARIVDIQLAAYDPAELAALLAGAAQQERR
ncbi:amino acid adenylation domain-containing protein [Catenulispora subtropica]|uniref:Carrier domain-containing protein n=1 Tax=Catenulispora subtropica TaxID=450798 RepID=A0ABN2T7G0_9ACTN